MSQLRHPAIEHGSRDRDPSCTWSALSEIGRRSLNEDSWGYVLTGSGVSAWVVADGLGGHEDGEVASRLAVSTFLAAVDCGQPPEPAVRVGMDAARLAVRALAERSEVSKAPSSTLLALAIQGRSGAVIHAGDSRLMQFRNGRLCFQTVDHNVREMLRGLGHVPEGPADGDPNASQLTRSLGQPPEGGDVLTALEFQAGDLFLLCSDGVSQHLPDKDPSWTAGAIDDEEALQRVARFVVSADSPRQDNYTAVCISIRAIENQNTRAKPVEWRLILAAMCLLGLFVLGALRNAGLLFPSPLPTPDKRQMRLPTRPAPASPPHAVQDSSARASDPGPAASSSSAAPTSAKTREARR